MKSAQMFLGILLFCGSANAQAAVGPTGPDIRVYKTVGAAKLTAHVFHPSQASDGKRAPGVSVTHDGWRRFLAKHGFLPESPLSQRIE